MKSKLKKEELNLMEKAPEAMRSIDEVLVRFVGVHIPLNLHKEFRMVAAKEGTSATALLRKLIVKHLDEAKGKG